MTAILFSWFSSRRICLPFVFLLLMLCVILLPGASPHSSAPPAPFRPDPEKEWTGTAKRVSFRGQTFATYVIDTRRSNIDFFYKDSSGSVFENFGNLRDFLAQHSRQLIFATNGTRKFLHFCHAF